jgi:CRP-like cAMP-binding protein
LTHMGQRTTREKLRSFLSAEAQRQGSAEFDIPFDRQELADYLSVDRSALSAELSRMRKEGILESNRSHFCLLQNE